MKKYQNPFKTLQKSEWCLWILSLAAITVGFLSVSEKDYFTLSASLIGVTALIFVAKGDPLGQAMTVVFSVLYSIISLTFRYYGEMITYLGMTAPIALLATISWFRHPHREGENEVRVTSVSPRKWVILIVLTALVTFAFYFVLKAFHTNHLAISTVSIATSFLASALTFLRSSWYGLGYGANDLVLVTMWILATMENPSYLPMVICFAVFFVNDCYGFFNWQRIRRRQLSEQRISASCREE